MTRPEEQAMDMTATLTDQLAPVRAAEELAEEARLAAAGQLRDVARELKARGWVPKDLAAALKAAGYTQAAIADAMELSPQRVSQLMSPERGPSRAEIERKAELARLTKRATQLYGKGLSHKDIAIRLDISVQKLSQLPYRAA